MAIRKIVKYGDPILRQKLKPVVFEEIAPQLPALLQDMEDIYNYLSYFFCIIYTQMHAKRQPSFHMPLLSPK